MVQVKILGCLVWCDRESGLLLLVLRWLSEFRSWKRDGAILMFLCILSGSFHKLVQIRVHYIISDDKDN